MDAKARAKLWRLFRREARSVQKQFRRYGRSLEPIPCSSWLRDDFNEALAPTPSLLQQQWSRLNESEFYQWLEWYLKGDKARKKLRAQGVEPWVGFSAQRRTEDLREAAGHKEPILEADLLAPELTAPWDEEDHFEADSGTDLREVGDDKSAFADRGRITWPRPLRLQGPIGPRLQSSLYDALAHGQKVLLILRHDHGFSYGTIGRMLGGVSEDAARQRYNRATRKLRAIWQPYIEAERAIDKALREYVPRSHVTTSGTIFGRGRPVLG